MTCWCRKKWYVVPFIAEIDFSSSLIEWAILCFPHWGKCNTSYMSEFQGDNSSNNNSSIARLCRHFWRRANSRRQSRSCILGEVHKQTFLNCWGQAKKVGCNEKNEDGNPFTYWLQGGQKRCKIGSWYCSWEVLRFVTNLPLVDSDHFLDLNGVEHARGAKVPRASCH